MSWICQKWFCSIQLVCTEHLLIFGQSQSTLKKKFKILLWLITIWTQKLSLNFLILDAKPDAFNFRWARLKAVQKLNERRSKWILNIHSQASGTVWYSLTSVSAEATVLQSRLLPGARWRWNWVSNSKRVRSYWIIHPFTQLVLVQHLLDGHHSVLRGGKCNLLLPGQIQWTCGIC